MVTISFRGGDLRDFVQKALAKKRGELAGRFDAVSDRLASQAIIAYKKNHDIKDFSEFTGNAMDELFTSSTGGNKQFGGFVVLRNKIDAGEVVVLEHPLEGTSRRIVGKADIQSEDNAMRYVPINKDGAFAIMRSGWPLEYLGMWRENPAPPSHYIRAMKKELKAIVFGIRKIYKMVVRHQNRA